jgi:hypothetical protein
VVGALTSSTFIVAEVLAGSLVPWAGLWALKHCIEQLQAISDGSLEALRLRASRVMDGSKVTRVLGHLLSQLTMWAFVLRLDIVAHPTLHRSHGESEGSSDDGARNSRPVTQITPVRIRY